jgi:chromosome segregation ATPase
MGFAGEVVLHKGNHEMDLPNYGLKLMVKFREKEALQPLAACTQSGGEKSVTTALYIMA